MDNFEAIKKMTRPMLEAFLDQVYLTGLNTGIYAAALPDSKKYDLLDKNPFDAKWLKCQAENATRNIQSDDGDEYLLDALAIAVLRNANIKFPEKSK